MSEHTVEQVCRFRTRRDGYGICAKSIGVTKENEEHVENELNDSLNPLFKGRVGKSVMSCTVVEQDVLLALSTLQTDALGRPAIFSNAYILPRTFYEENMKKAPGSILYAQTTPSLTHQPGNSMLPAVEFELAVEIPELDSLRRKYGLSDERYAELLWAASLALTGEGSLCLKTKLPRRNEFETVRDICYCIAVGLPSDLRKNITYSSAGDTHKRVCFSGPQSGILSGDCIEFDLDAEDVLEKMNNLECLVYQALVGAGTETRRRLLQEMEQWTARFFEEPCIDTEPLIVVSYCCSQKVPLSAKQRRRLLYLLLVSLQKKKFMPAIDQAVAELLMGLDEMPTESSRMLLDRVVQGENETLLKQICQLIAGSAPAVQTEGLAKAIEGSFEGRSEQIFCELTDRLPAELEVHTEKMRDREIRYILTHRIAEKGRYACALMKRQSAESRKQWANCILSAETGAYETLDWELLRTATEKTDDSDGKLQLTKKARTNWENLIKENAVPDDILERVNLCVLRAESEVPEKLTEEVEYLLDPEVSPRYQEVLCRTIIKYRDELSVFYAKLVIEGEKCASPEEWMEHLKALEDEWLLRNAQKEIEERTLRYYESVERGQVEEHLKDLCQQEEELRQTKLSPELQMKILEQEEAWALRRLSIRQLMQIPMEPEAARQTAWWEILKSLCLRSDPRARFVSACRALVEERNGEEMDHLLSEKANGMTREEKESFRGQLLPWTQKLYQEKQSFTWKAMFWYCFMPDGVACPHAAYEFMSSREMHVIAEQEGADPAEIRKECPEWVTLEMRQNLGKELKKDAGFRAQKLVKLVEQELCSKEQAEKGRHTEKMTEEKKARHEAEGTGMLKKLGMFLKK